jgi:glutamyl-tRNA synthetase
MTGVTVRFAPSPTGRLHIGNARTALLNYLHARRHSGRFLLRYDDTDRARSTAEFAEAIATDLAWLGIVPDFTARQSDRFAHYDAAAQQLRDAGLLYACYETEEELTYRRRRQIAQHKPPIYDRAALKLTAEDRARLEGEGRKPHWRFRLAPRTVSWDDGVRGPVSIDCTSLSDPVLVREDGTYLYTLPSVVDDIAFGITDVIRGEDHVTNTAVQIQIFEALSGAAPRFAHHNLLTLASGEGLSKRSGHLSLGTLRETGYEPNAVAALAVLTGTSHNVEAIAELDELIEKVALSDISHSPAKFDPSELDALNARTLHRMAFAQVEERLRSLGIDANEEFWLAVRGNLARLSDAMAWWRVCASDEAFPGEDPALLAAALPLLPGEPWDHATWSLWTKAVGAVTGKKGRALFHPLRLALTGREQGPELKLLLPLIGRERAARRLAAASR